MSRDTHPAMTYPTERQYEQWETDADEYGMNMSEFMKAMIEAGRKKFGVTVEPDQTNRELRKQRNDLKDELNQTRERVSDLETQLHHGERATIQQFVEENPGATFDQIIQHVMDTVPGRVAVHLDDLEGELLRVEDGQYYPAAADEGGT